MISRRELLAAGAIFPLFGASSILRANEPDLSALRAITGNARPLEAAERTRRLTRAQALMQATDIGAVVIEPGSSMIHSPGVEWWRSERLAAVVLRAAARGGGNGPVMTCATRWSPSRRNKKRKYCLAPKHVP